MTKKKVSVKVSVKEFIEEYNPMLTRRGKKMSYSYIYRMIRQHMNGENKRPLWFEYVMEGEKDNIYILVKK